MAPTQQMKLAAKMKAMQGSGKGLGAEASMTSMVSTGNMSVIKEDADYKSEKSKGNPWVDPMEGLEGAAFRFMAQVEGYLSKEWKLFDRHMRYLSKGMAPGEVDEVTGRQAKGGRTPRATRRTLCHAAACPCQPPALRAARTPGRCGRPGAGAHPCAQARRAAVGCSVDVRGHGGGERHGRGAGGRGGRGRPVRGPGGARARGRTP